MTTSTAGTFRTKNAEVYFETGENAHYRITVDAEYAMGLSEENFFERHYIVNNEKRAWGLLGAISMREPNPNNSINRKVTS